MATKLDIYNLALYKLAQSNVLASTSDEAKATDVMNRLWVPMRDLVLEARTWPWALKVEALALDVQAAQPGWQYRYGYPNDCITAKAVTNENGLRVVRDLGSYCDKNFLRTGLGRWAFDWSTGYGDQGTTINTDIEQAYLVYIARIEDEGRFSAGFVNALACMLAAEAAPPIIGEVGLNNKSSLLQEYQLALTNAGAHDYGESEESDTWVSGSEAARG